MKAAQFSQFGGPEVLEIVNLPDPYPGPGQVRIVVRAAGISGTDWKLRAGALSFGAELPQTTGSDVAGVVDEVGEGVASGSTLFINGASGGIGSTAVQLAVARGARVIGAASAANQNYLSLLGAEPVSYGDGMAERVRALAPAGVDVARPSTRPFRSPRSPRRTASASTATSGAGSCSWSAKAGRPRRRTGCGGWPCGICQAASPTAPGPVRWRCRAPGGGRTERTARTPVPATRR